MENERTNPVANDLDNFFDISFDSVTRAHIKKAAVWAKVYTLCAFVGYGIVLIVAIFGRLNLPQTETSFPFSNWIRAGSIATALISILIGGFINYFLYRFASVTARGVDTMDSLKTNEGFNNLRIYFKILGIILIIIFSLVSLFILFAIFGFAFSSR